MFIWKTRSVWEELYMKVVVSVRIGAFFSLCDIEKLTLCDVSELLSAMRIKEKSLLEIVL